VIYDQLLKTSWKTVQLSNSVNAEALDLKHMAELKRIPTERTLIHLLYKPRIETSGKHLHSKQNEM